MNNPTPAQADPERITLSPLQLPPAAGYVTLDLATTGDGQGAITIDLYQHDTHLHHHHGIVSAGVARIPIPADVVDRLEVDPDGWVRGLSATATLTAVMLEAEPEPRRRRRWWQW